MNATHFLVIAALAAAPATAASGAPNEANQLSAYTGGHAFPLVDQLHESTNDGHPSENARMNCVPTSVAAGMTYLLGKHFDGDQLKHAVYGESYVGLTSPGRFASFARTQGVLLKRVTADSQEELVVKLRQLLARGVPALVAMPAAWKETPDNPLKPNTTTHVGVAVGLGPKGQIRVMNPWGGFWQDGDDAYWAARLCYGELWTMELADPGAPQLVQREQRDQPPSAAGAAAAPTR